VSNHTEITITILNHDYTATEPRWQSTIDMMKSSTEQRIFKKEGDSRVKSVKSYRQVKSPPGDSLPRHAPTSLPRSRLRSLLRVDQDSTEAAYRERTYEVDRMFTEADFQRQLPCHAASTSQCRVPMTTGCKIYSTEHPEALHRAQTALARLNW
jgi:hypothetical protein